MGAPRAVVISQPVPAVTSQDVERVVARDFPSEIAHKVAAILGEYGGDDAHRDNDRVRLAALKLAAGDVERVRAAIEMAKRDFRDVLALAEYPEYSRTVRPSADLSAAERQRIVDADWRQYSEWLAR